MHNSWELTAHLMGRSVPWEILEHLGCFWTNKQTKKNPNFETSAFSYNWKHQILQKFQIQKGNTELQNDIQGREQPATITSPFTTCTNLPRNAGKAKFASPRMMTKPEMVEPRNPDGEGRLLLLLLGSCRGDPGTQSGPQAAHFYPELTEDDAV